MPAEVIGRLKSGAGQKYDVKWDHVRRDTYVSYAGWAYCGVASTASEAMNKAEAFLYDR